MKRISLKKWVSHSLSVAALVLCWFGLSSQLQADDSDLDPLLHRTGAKPLTEEQIHTIQATWPQLIGVRPNKLGLVRIEKHMGDIGLCIGGCDGERSQILLDAVNKGEFLTNQNADPLEVSSLRANLATLALPSRVDNSALTCFPPIGDQGAQGSCVGWATTYYQATHEYGLLNGINNKTNSSGIRSPKWTYNMLNEGQDFGLWPTDAYALLQTNGAAAMNDFPYTMNYRDWDLKTQDWISALSYRMDHAQFFTIVSPGINVDTLKQLLVNGHIVSFVTYAYSWQFTKVKADPAEASNPYAGQNAISWMNGQAGGHHVNIVGYDDKVWIDINNNGQVDPGEKGAFLMANSWGTGWGNNGYMWIAYDAFYANSTVVNGPSANRQPVAQMLFNIVPKSANYKPKAVAKFSVSQATRNQLYMSLGVSSTNGTAPTNAFESAALSGDGGSFAFDGTSPKLLTATFALDLTDLLPTTNDVQKYYLVARDSAASSPSTLNSYSILDLVSNQEISYNGGPINFDNSTIQPTILFQQSNNNPDQPPSVNITSPANQSTLHGSVFLTANATDDIGVSRVDFYVDTTLINTDLVNPYSYMLDTTRLANGQHTLSAIAYDTTGKHARSDITVNVLNESDTTPPTVQINSPGNGSNVSGVTNFSAVATDNVGVAKVEFYTDSTLQKTVSSFPYTTPIDTTQLSNGQHQFKAVAYDTSGNTAQQTIMVNVQNGGTLPAVAITYPTNNHYVGGSVLVQVSASASSGIARVELLVDCKVFGIDSSAPYTFLVNTGFLSQGPHTLTAIAVDNTGKFNQTNIVFNVAN